MTDVFWQPAGDGRGAQWVRTAMAVAVTAVLLALVAANVVSRTTWREVEDGVLWEVRAEGVVAATVSQDGAGGRGLVGGEPDDDAFGR